MCGAPLGFQTPSHDQFHLMFLDQMSHSHRTGGREGGDVRKEGVKGCVCVLEHIQDDLV